MRKTADPGNGANKEMKFIKKAEESGRELAEGLVFVSRRGISVAGVKKKKKKQNITTNVFKIVELIVEVDNFLSCLIVSPKIYEVESRQYHSV